MLTLPTHFKKERKWIQEKAIKKNKRKRRARVPKFEQDPGFKDRSKKQLEQQYY
jgi:hypothetical protein